MDKPLARLRVTLLQEKVGESVTASEKDDLIAIADAPADIAYVYGTVLTYGIDMDSVLREVHRSNMSKLGRDGKPLMREDGKSSNRTGTSRPTSPRPSGFQDR